jgi:adenylyl cyclase-associated protein
VPSSHRVCIKPAPREFIESAIGGSDYWANNIRKQYKGVNADQIEFCNTFKALLTGLVDYVKEHHLTGVTWNPKGVDAKGYDAKSAGAASASSGAKAAAPAAAAAKPSATEPAAAAKVDLFAALNKDSAITSGLKKVTKDMQTWRSEYKAGDAPAAAAAAPAVKPAASAAVAMKYPPKCTFASNKWSVEYQTAEQGVVDIAIEDKKETVYILGCVGATISIKGKCKSIVVDSCKKTKVIFQAAMASCEVVNCQRMQIVCEETVAAVAIDKTDGIVVTLPRSSLNTEVVASKSSEMNLSWPDENGDMVEKPIPEQYVHRIQGMSVTANVSDLYSH